MDEKKEWPVSSLLIDLVETKKEVAAAAEAAFRQASINFNQVMSRVAADVGVPKEIRDLAAKDPQVLTLDTDSSKFIYDPPKEPEDAKGDEDIS